MKQLTTLLTLLLLCATTNARDLLPRDAMSSPLKLPFAEDATVARASRDFSQNLKLNAEKEFFLELTTATPRAGMKVSLYFHSGDGWYSGSSALYTHGKNVLRFDREKFRSEGKPGSWDEVDKVRVSFWRTQNQDGEIQLLGLTTTPPAGFVAREKRKLDATYLATLQPPKDEVMRGFWNHSGQGLYHGDWEKTAAALKKANINAIFPNFLWDGRGALYPSKVLPDDRRLAECGDQIAAAVKACHAQGIEVHAWKVCYNLLGVRKEAAEQFEKEGRLIVPLANAATNKPEAGKKWLCPSHPANQKMQVESLLEVAANYDVDGVHLDYIRYPGSQYCYCQGCKERFEKKLGQKVNWPSDCTDKYAKQYNLFRQEQITKVVQELSQRLRALNAKTKRNVKLSAAVFQSYPSCKKDVLQDWVLWTQKGYLDFVCPMNYTTSPLHFEALCEEQKKLVGGRTPIYPGIGAWRLTSPRALVEQIDVAWKQGAKGFVLFDLSEKHATEFLPALGRLPKK